MCALGVGDEIKVFPKEKSVPQGNLVKKGITDGVLFFTYALLISGGKLQPESQLARDTKEKKKRKGVDMNRAIDTFSKNHKSRLTQVVEWLRGSNPKETACPLIVLDECHKAKNLVSVGGVPTQTGMAVIAIQALLPNAKVVYSSATGATEPLNLAYMSRVGYYGYDSMTSFLHSINEMGLGAMEMLAMSLKGMGMYVSRTLSYRGAVFQMSELTLSKDQELMYDRSAQFWQMLYKVFFPNVQEDGKLRTKEVKKQLASAKANFWAAHMRFFRQMLIASKVPYLCERVNTALENNQCAVIGLQSTGEAGAKSLGLSDGDEMTDLISAPKLVLVNLITNFLEKALEHIPRQYLKVILVQLKESLDAWVGRESVNDVAKRLAAKGLEDGREKITTRISGIQEKTDNAEIDCEAQRQQLLAERLASAKRTGMFFDFTAELQPGQLEDARKRAAEAAQQRKQAAQQEANLDSEVVDLVVSDTEDDDEVPMEATVGSCLRKKPTAHSPSTPLGGLAQSTLQPNKRPSPVQLSYGSALKKTKTTKDDLDVETSTKFEFAEAKKGEIAPEQSPGTDESTSCEVCKKSSQAELMLLCDGCDKGYHTSCLSPPLRSIPSGEWFCSSCASSGGRRPSAAATTETVSEYVDRQLDSDSDEMISLDGSDSEYDPEEEQQARKDLRATKGKGPAETATVEDSSDVVIISDDDSSDDDSDIFFRAMGRASNSTVKQSQTRSKAIRDRCLQSRPMTEGWQDEEVGDFKSYNPLITDIGQMLLRAVDALELPPNPLDEITANCGGPDNVAEMTGRAMHVVRDEDGKITYKRRKEEMSKKDINLSEMGDFMEGKKLVAIISDAASTGISLHADRGVKNQRQRVHFTLELPWSADMAIQQFGRSHRSNQAVAPIYDLMITKCGGERRFASCAARRLMSLGALTRGDRRAMGAGGDLKEFDIDGNCGRRALKRILQDITGRTNGPMPGVPDPELPPSLQAEFEASPKGYASSICEEYIAAHSKAAAFYSHMQECCQAVGLMDEELAVQDGASFSGEKGMKLDRFLNRLLGMRIEEQSALFSYFEDSYFAEVRAAKSRGEISSGMITLGGYTSMQQVNSELLHTDLSTHANTYLAHLRGDKRIKWEDAWLMCEENKKDAESRHADNAVAVVGFYEAKRKDLFGRAQIGGRTVPHIVLVTYRMQVYNQRMDFMKFNMIRPFGNIRGRYKTVEEFHNIESNYKKIDDIRAKALWEQWYMHTQRSCIHGDDCPNKKKGTSCYLGMREDLYIVEGAILPIWKIIMEKRNGLLDIRKKQSSSKKGNSFQVVKVNLTQRNEFAQEGQNTADRAVVGMTLEPGQVDQLKRALNAQASASQAPIVLD